MTSWKTALYSGRQGSGLSTNLSRGSSASGSTGRPCCTPPVMKNSCVSKLSTISFSYRYEPYSMARGLIQVGYRPYTQLLVHVKYRLHLLIPLSLCLPSMYVVHKTSNILLMHDKNHFYQPYDAGIAYIMSGFPLGELTNLFIRIRCWFQASLAQSKSFCNTGMKQNRTSSLQKK